MKLTHVNTQEVNTRKNCIATQVKLMRRRTTWRRSVFSHVCGLGGYLDFTPCQFKESRFWDMGSAYYGGQLKATGHQSEIEIERTFAICHLFQSVVCILWFRFREVSQPVGTRGASSYYGQTLYLNFLIVTLMTNENHSSYCLLLFIVIILYKL